MELSQEAFFRAYSNLDRLNENSSFFPWFYQILKNLCFSHLRRRRYRQAEPLDVHSDDHGMVVSGGIFDPEAAAENNELKVRLWEAIDKLSDKHREVIILRHFQNLSYEQMAQMLYCSKGTVTSRLYQARGRLKELLNERKEVSQNDLPGS